jgi:hypothetical protein
VRTHHPAKSELTKSAGRYLQSLGEITVRNGDGIETKTLPDISVAEKKQPRAFANVRRRIFDERSADQLRRCFLWRSQGESNPCFGLERATS